VTLDISQLEVISKNVDNAKMISRSLKDIVMKQTPVSTYSDMGLSSAIKKVKGAQNPDQQRLAELQAEDRRRKAGKGKVKRFAKRKVKEGARKVKEKVSEARQKRKLKTKGGKKTFEERQKLRKGKRKVEEKEGRTAQKKKGKKQKQSVKRQEKRYRGVLKKGRKDKSTGWTPTDQTLYDDLSKLREETGEIPQKYAADWKRVQEKRSKLEARKKKVKGTLKKQKTERYKKKKETHFVEGAEEIKDQISELEEVLNNPAISSNVKGQIRGDIKRLNRKVKNFRNFEQLEKTKMEEQIRGVLSEKTKTQQEQEIKEGRKTGISALEKLKDLPGLDDETLATINEAIQKTKTVESRAKDKEKFESQISSGRGQITADNKKFDAAITSLGTLALPKADKDRMVERIEKQKLKEDDFEKAMRDGSASSLAEFRLMQGTETINEKLSTIPEEVINNLSEQQKQNIIENRASYVPASAVSTQAKVGLSSLVRDLYSGSIFIDKEGLSKVATNLKGQENNPRLKDAHNQIKEALSSTDPKHPLNYLVQSLNDHEHKKLWDSLSPPIRPERGVGSYNPTASRSANDMDIVTKSLEDTLAAAKNMILTPPIDKAFELSNILSKSIKELNENGANNL